MQAYGVLAVPLLLINTAVGLNTVVLVGNLAQYGGTMARFLAAPNSPLSYLPQCQTHNQVSSPAHPSKMFIYGALSGRVASEK